MKLYFLRHTDTLDTEQGINGSQTDTPLSPNGEKQAQELIPLLSKNKYDIFVVSTLKRTHQTIQPFLETLTNPKLIEDGLTIERDLGKLTNTRRGEIAAYQKEHNITDRIAWRPPNGESILDVFDRAKKFLNKIKQHYPDKTILISGHQNFLRCLEIAILNKDIRDFYTMDPPRLSTGELRTYNL